MRNLKLSDKYIWLFLFLLVGAGATVRMLWHINGDYFTFLDEYPTFDVAAGFLHTGKFYLWDFHQQKLTETEYIRAWPHTLLLAGWFRIFGVSVVAGKVLSALFGVLFVLSLFYITKQIYNNYYISLLSCLIVMTNSTVITVFRQIRMYSLWLLGMAWVIYFAYRMLTVMPITGGPSEAGETLGAGGPSKAGETSKTQTISNSEKILSKRGLWSRIVLWWRRNLNFSIPYILLFLISLAFSYFVQVNTLAIGAGIALFFLYLLLTKRERRYFVALAVIAALALSCAAALLLLPRYGGAYESFDIIGLLKKNLSFREEVNDRYWDWTVDFVHNARLFRLSCLCVAAAFAGYIVDFLKKGKKGEKKEAFSFSVYLLLSTVSTLICFLYLLSRYYQARYMIYIAPMLAILMAWGIVECCQAASDFLSGFLFERLAQREGSEDGQTHGAVGKPEALKGALLSAAALLCCLLLAGSMRRQYVEVYANEAICYHRQAYGIVREDAQAWLGDGTVPIVGFDFRDYYGVQVFDEYETAAMDRENDARIWQEFGERYPEGYIMLESAKINGFPEVIKRFVQDYSERVAGEGLDHYNIEAVRYHFLSPVCRETGDLPAVGEEIAGEAPRLGYSIENKGGGARLVIRVDMDSLEQSAELLLLKLTLPSSEGEGEEFSFQLRLPESGRDGIYCYETSLPEMFWGDLPYTLLENGFMLYYNDRTIEEWEG